ncbi:MAG: acyl-CoA dehydrogenase [Castellaniella sp.]
MRELLELMLYDWLHAEELCRRPRYAAHSRDVFDAVLDASQRVAEDRFAPLNRLLDTEEPRLEAGRVVLPPPVRGALEAYAELGLPAAGHDEDEGGLQLPYMVDLAANAFFSRASIGLSAYPMLTYANANLLMAHGTPAQRRAFAGPEQRGECFGTMCLSEPQAGSSLAEIATRARPDGPAFEQDPLGPRYRLFGNKMWISGGEHTLSANILHLVLARSENEHGASIPGVRGLSLFAVPRLLVDEQGRPGGERNDITLMGLNHKLGYRGTVNTLLAFGDGGHPVSSRADGQGDRAPGAVGYRIGAAGEGLALMFHMMNEARLNVGMGAAMLGLAGYEASLQYARERSQGSVTEQAEGRRVQRPARLVEHADVRRMLLAQRAYALGGLALCLYCARLVDEKRTGAAADADRAAALLELLTPVAKSWPSQWCLEANSLAIQVHGGYGYTRDFPVEQHWRDNRLNMIHEGTHGIQALDLLRRKILRDDGRALSLWLERVDATLAQARAVPGLQPFADALEAGLADVQQAVARVRASDDMARVLSNATPFLEAFGHVVTAWVWLDLSLCLQARAASADTPWLSGLRQTAAYFFHHELPKVRAWLAPFETLDDTCMAMQDAWF